MSNTPNDTSSNTTPSLIKRKVSDLSFSEEVVCDISNFENIFNFNELDKILELSTSIDNIERLYETERPLGDIHISGNWSIYNYNNEKTSSKDGTDSNLNLTLEDGYKAVFIGKWKWKSDELQRKAESCSGDFGTDLPENDTYSEEKTFSEVITTKEYSQTIKSSELDKLKVENNNVVKTTSVDQKKISVKVTFKHSYYFGSCNLKDYTSPKIDEISSLLQKDLTTTKNLTKNNVTADNEKYLVYAYPKSLGDLTKITQNGSIDIIGAFSKTVLKITNVTKKQIDYNVYVSNNPNAFTNVTLQFN